MLKVHDLDPDGVRIVVNWDKMQVNASVFILCVNVNKAKKQAKNVTELKGWKIVTRVVVEDNKLGLRVWRTA